MFSLLRGNFSLFQNNPAKPTRLEENATLKQLIPIINELRIKNIELAKASHQYGETSIDAKKHGIVTRLIALLDKHIDNFNQAQTVGVEPEILKKQELELAQNLYKIVHALSNKMTPENKILATPRNDQRKTVNSLIQLGPTAAAIAVASVTPLSFPVGVIATFITFEASGFINEISGLNKLTPKSVLLLQELETKLTMASLEMKENASQDNLTIKSKSI